MSHVLQQCTIVKIILMVYNYVFLKGQIRTNDDKNQIIFDQNLQYLLELMV